MARRRHDTRPPIGARWRIAALATGVTALILGLPALAGAHIERPAYWPDPKPDTAVTPSAGGKVPTAKTLSSALDASRPGHTLVVCKTNSLYLARKNTPTAPEKP